MASLSLASPVPAASSRRRRKPIAPAGVDVPVLVGVPLTETDEFSTHFGASAKAGLFTVDVAQRRITELTCVVPATPEPCGWADWLAARGVKVFLAGGMGRGAQERMTAAGIEVIAGLSPAMPTLLVQAWLNRTLKPGPNGCNRRGGRQPPRDERHPGRPSGADDRCCCTR